MEKPFEIRCVENSDMSDYHWAWCSSLQVALDNLQKLNEAGSIYEHYYVIEHHEDGSKTIPEYDRNTYKPLQQPSEKELSDEIVSTPIIRTIPVDIIKSAISDFEAIKRKVVSTLKSKEKNMQALEHEADKSWENIDANERYAECENKMLYLEKEMDLLKDTIKYISSIIADYNKMITNE